MFYFASFLVSTISQEENVTIIIISPLIALIYDQVKRLPAETTAILIATDDYRGSWKKIRYVFTTAETALLKQDLWSKLTNYWSNY